jgi:hypothetical protein
MTKCAFRAFLSVPKEPDNSRECTDREEVRSEFQVAVKRQDSIGAAPREGSMSGRRQRGDGRIERFEGRRWRDRSRKLAMGFQSLQA